MNGVEEIKVHPFFAGVDWKRIREKRSPNIPEVQSKLYELDILTIDLYSS